jgi:hypothetical protein
LSVAEAIPGVRVHGSTALSEPGVALPQPTRASAVRRAIVEHPVAAAFLLALLARGVLVAIIAVRNGGTLFDDDHQYVVLAGDVVRGRTGDWDQYTRGLYDSNATFMWPVTALFAVFGVHAVLGQAFVALAGAGTAAIVARLVLEFAGPRIALVSGAAVAVMPSQVLFSSLTLKDALVWACLSGIALVAAVAGRVHGRSLAKAGLACLVLLVLLGFLRQHTLVVAAWALVLTTWLGDAESRGRRMAAAAALALAVPFVAGAGVGGIGLLDRTASLAEQRALGAQGAATALVSPAPDIGNLPRPSPSARPDVAQLPAQVQAAATRARTAQQQVQQALRTLQQPSPPPDAAARLAAARREAEQARLESELLRQRLASAASPAPVADNPTPAPDVDTAFGSGVGSSTAGSNLAYLPHGLAVMALYPYPWSAQSSGRMQLARVEMVLWYPLLLLAAVGLLGLRRHARVLSFPIVGGGGIATMWALVEGNFGTAYRHRGEFVWAVVVLAAAGLSVLLGALRGTPGGDGVVEADPVD